MFSLQRILGKEDKFFDLLQASAQEVKTSVQALVALIDNPTEAGLEKFVASRRKEKQIASEISDALCTTFITAFEREDIEALSQALYRIPKTIEKTGERILLAPQFVTGIDFSRQTTMMKDAADVLVEMLKQLPQLNPEQIGAFNAKLQKIESEADDLMLKVLEDLYSGHYAPLQTVFLKDIYELLEKIFDRFRNAGNELNHIVLKNS
jgi:uncharacterized protein Yka (UPF0111/DUF47 family)